MEHLQRKGWLDLFFPDSSLIEERKKHRRRREMRQMKNTNPLAAAMHEHHTAINM